MKEYKVGQSYEFDVKDWGTQNNNKYLLVTDGENDCRIFDIFPDLVDSLRGKVFAKIKQIDILNKVKLAFDVDKFNRDHYFIGEKKLFLVTGSFVDKNGYTVYNVEDSMGSYTTYAPAGKTYHIGDKVVLTIKAFKQKGGLQLEKVDLATTPSPSSIVTTNDTTTSTTDPSILDLPNEGTQIELKTSIVFPPGCNGVVNIPEQMATILKELAAFMNAEGGKLYIGVHDKSHAITGIENDYPHLNNDPNQISGYHYGPDEDGYERKIRDALRRKSQSIANSLLEFDFKKANDKTYCVITVKKANLPIWIDGNLLYQRIGNEVQQLKGDNINNFVSERMTSSIKDLIESNKSKHLSADEIRTLFQDVIEKSIVDKLSTVASSKIDSIVPPDPVDRSGEIDYWIIWKKDATWCRQRDESTDDDVFYQLPVHKNNRSELLVFCYEEGNVNLVKLKDFKQGVNLKDVKKDGFYSQGGVKPLRIFLTHNTAMLALFSIDVNGTKFVKLHTLSEFNTTKSGKSKGARFVPNPGKIFECKLVKSYDYKKVQPLICTSKETTRTFGTPLDSQAYPDQVAYVANLK